MIMLEICQHDSDCNIQLGWSLLKVSEKVEKKTDWVDVQVRCDARVLEKLQWNAYTNKLTAKRKDTEIIIDKTVKGDDSYEGGDGNSFPSWLQVSRVHVSLSCCFMEWKKR